MKSLLCGEGFFIVDLTENLRGSGFSQRYIIDMYFCSVKCAKDKQVARCGNAVPPPFAEALVRANLPDMCLKKGIAA